MGMLVDPLPQANILGGMWRLAQKRDKDNHIVWYKARWVAFGNHQVEGLNYDETYASVGSVNSLRILLAIVAGLNWVVWQFDVVTAFLNGKMTVDVYVKQVRNFEHPTHPNCVWRLDRSLYGTKQASHCWLKDFNASVAKFNLLPCPSDSAIYLLQDHRGTLIVHLHVDDSLIFFSSKTFMLEFQAFLDSQYKIKWDTPPTLYLGIKLNIQPGFISISQPH